MEENKQHSNRNIPGWVGGITIFADISAWIVVPIVCALVFGKMLDTHYGTEPIIFLCLTFLGFAVSVWGIVRVVKKYTAEMKKENNNLWKKK